MDLTERIAAESRAALADGAKYQAETFALALREIERLRTAALPFAQHDWMDAELEDDSCKLTKHSGPVTVGHWRALRAALGQS